MNYTRYLILISLISIFPTDNLFAQKENKIIFHMENTNTKISKDIYGQFAEHLGRCIYDGIWVGEESDIPNTKGYRKDILEALKALDIPVLRWPGGCFADTYHWKDGIGPKDQRPSMLNIWWGNVNRKLTEASFLVNRTRAIDYLNTRTELYCIDGFAGWDESRRIKVRVICSRPYHALFMHNMLIRPSAAELGSFGEPDYVIFNAGAFPANPHTVGMSSDTSVALNFASRSAKPCTLCVCTCTPQRPLARASGMRRLRAHSST